MNSRNQEQQQQQEQAEHLAKHGVGAGAEPLPGWAGWYVVGRYRTKGGDVGVEIRISAKTGRFSYTGKWGAGSGHDKANMVEFLQQMMRGRRGVIAEIPFHVDAPIYSINVQRDGDDHSMAWHFDCPEQLAKAMKHCHDHKATATPLATNGVPRGDYMTDAEELRVWLAFEYLTTEESA